MRHRPISSFLRIHAGLSEIIARAVVTRERYIRSRGIRTVRDQKGHLHSGLIGLHIFSTGYSVYRNARPGNQCDQVHAYHASFIPYAILVSHACKTKVEQYPQHDQEERLCNIQPVRRVSMIMHANSQTPSNARHSVRRKDPGIIQKSSSKVKAPPFSGATASSSCVPAASCAALSWVFLLPAMTPAF